MRELNPRDLADFWWQMFDASFDKSVPMEQHLDLHQKAQHYQRLYEDWCVDQEWKSRNEQPMTAQEAEEIRMFVDSLNDDDIPF
jgi:hypothetical protein